MYQRTRMRAPALVHTRSVGYGVMAYAVDLEQLRAAAAQREIETEPALQQLCAELGQMLSNERWQAMRSDWFEVVDNAIGVSLMSGLFYVGSPVDLFAPDDDYTVGHIAPGAIGDLAHDLLDALDRGGIEAHIEAAVEEVLDWFEVAETRGGLVTFFY
jgi:hypothetical protein